MGNSDEAITVKALASLPSLDQITFLRKASRDFVTGRGPLPVVISPFLGRFFQIIAAIFGIAGIGFTFAAFDPMLIFGAPLSKANDWIWIIGPSLMVLALFDFGVSVYFRKLVERERQLAESGGLLPGELISARLRASRNGNYLRLECRFIQPGGKPMVARKTAGRFDLNPKSLPPAGSKLLVLYKSDRLWQVL